MLGLCGLNLTLRVCMHVYVCVGGGVLMQRLEDGEMDDREQRYHEFVVRLKAIMKQKKGPRITDKELAQVTLEEGQEWANFNNKKMKKR